MKLILFVLQIFTIFHHGQSIGITTPDCVCSALADKIVQLFKADEAYLDYITENVHMKARMATYSLRAIKDSSLISKTPTHYIVQCVYTQKYTVQYSVAGTGTTIESSMVTESRENIFAATLSISQTCGVCRVDKVMKIEGDDTPLNLPTLLHGVSDIVKNAMTDTINQGFLKYVNKEMFPVGVTLYQILQCEMMQYQSTSCDLTENGFCIHYIGEGDKLKEFEISHASAKKRSLRSVENEELMAYSNGEFMMAKVNPKRNLCFSNNFFCPNKQYIREIMKRSEPPLNVVNCMGELAIEQVSRELNELGKSIQMESGGFNYKGSMSFVDFTLTNPSDCAFLKTGDSFIIDCRVMIKNWTCDLETTLEDGTKYKLLDFTLNSVECELKVSFNRWCGFCKIEHMSIISSKPESIIHDNLVMTDMAKITRDALWADCTKFSPWVEYNNGKSVASTDLMAASNCANDLSSFCLENLRDECERFTK